MDSTGGTLPPNFMLTPQQQSLLFAALNSNKSQQNGNTGNGLTLSPDSFENNPPSTNANGFQESPFLDTYNYEDVGDSSFDFSLIDDQQPKMIGDLPGSANSDSADGEGNEKRSHPDDDDDDSNDPKRRESTEKVPKKPGRKPLTSEPSSKRKAQNRAAQRAFRERKEKHLKDLETQVEELQKASQATNHENAKLRAQVDRMTNELKQYKQKVSLLTNPKALPKEKVPFGASAVGNLNDVNFQFNFPKFGTLPGPQMSKPQRSASQPISPSQQQQAVSPQKSQQDTKSPNMWQQTSDAQFKEDLAKFSGVFTPSMASSVTNNSRGSLDSANYSVGGATSSPSASSHSNGGPSSSCGTSPEPFTQSPMGSKPIETMTTIGEEQPSHSTEPFAQFANIDFNSNSNFDWLAQQNNSGSFDPQLFGDYREPQENILSNPSFDDFFNDSLDTDFFTPYNMAPTSNFGSLNNGQQHQEPAKPSLMDKIEAQKNDYDEGLVAKKDSMNCNQIWERLQECPKAQSGEFDLDGLCSELTKKAKCSGNGPVVGETDFDTILKKYMGKDASSDCVASKLGIEINRDAKPNGVSMP